MAVEKMRLINIVGPLEDFDEVVRNCLIDREFQPENVGNMLGRVKRLRPFTIENPYQALLKQAYGVIEEEELSPDYRDFRKLSMSCEEIGRYLAELSEKNSGLRKEKDRLFEAVRENEQIIIQLQHLENMNAKLDDLFHFEFVQIRIGRLPTESYNGFIQHIDEEDSIFFFPATIDRDYVYGLYCMPRSIEEKADAMFAGLHFERIRISDRAHGTPLEAEESLRRDTESLRQRLSEVEDRLSSLKKEETEKLLSCYSYLRNRNDTYELRRNAAHTEDSFYIIGWVPEESLAGITGLLDACRDVSYTLDKPGVSAALFNPPTKLRNHRFVRPFEMFTSMYGLPGYNEFDPSALLAITYSLFFGLMFGDIGQGLIICVTGFLLWKYKRMTLGRVMERIGLFSTLFGIMYGSIFGNEELWGEWTGLPTFNVLRSGTETNLALVLAIVLGALTIMLVMVVNIANGVRNHDVEKSLFSPNGLAGFVLYWAVLLTVLSLVGFHIIPDSWRPAFYIVGFAIPLVAIFFKQPLGRLAARRRDWKPDSIGEFIIENVIELFDVLLTMMTNTISFVRIGAFAISHAIMMMVVYTLAGGMESSNPVVIVIGNIFVIGLEGLIVGIQCLRLQFYEMFSRFYGGDGRPYTPYRTNYKEKKY